MNAHDTYRRALDSLGEHHPSTIALRAALMAPPCDQDTLEDAVSEARSALGDYCWVCRDEIDEGGDGTRRECGEDCYWRVNTDAEHHRGMFR